MVIVAFVLVGLIAIQDLLLFLVPVVLVVANILAAVTLAVYACELMLKVLESHSYGLVFTLSWSW